MKALRYIIAASLFAVASIAANAQAGPSASVVIFNSAASPCQSGSIAKISLPVNIVAAGTTALVPAVAGKTIYVCGFSATVNGTTPTLLFKSGTQTTTPCDTGAASLTGTFAPTTGSLLTLLHTATIFQSGVSGQLCATTGGTTPSIQGFILYVQQ